MSQAWPICNPDHVLKALKSLKADVCHKGKAFYASYNSSWAKLNDVQKNKATEFFNVQSEAIKVAVNTAALEFEREAVAETQRNAESTNKHDRARLLHLYVYPGAQVHWSQAATPLTRQELDAPVDTVAPFSALAEMFNDYEAVVFQNATIRHSEDGKPLTPFQALSGMENIANRTWELNPCDASRPLRDGGWIRKKMLELRADITIFRLTRQKRH